MPNLDLIKRLLHGYFTETAKMNDIHGCPSCSEAVLKDIGKIYMKQSTTYIENINDMHDY